MPSPHPIPVTIARFSESDAGGLARLRASCGRDPRQAWDEEERWLYGSAPSGYGECGLWVAKEGAVVAGQLGSLRSSFRIDGEVVEGHYLMDLLVDPAFRRRGIAARLIEAVRASSGILWMVGMTAPARALYQRLGYQKLGELHTVYFPRNPAALAAELAARLSGRAALARLLRTPLARAGAAAAIALLSARRLRAPSDPRRTMTSTRPDPAELTLLWNAGGEAYRWIAPRDAPWISWRYWRRPHAAYIERYLRCGGELEGWLIAGTRALASGAREGAIVDWFCLPGRPGAPERLVMAALEALEEAGADYVKATCSHARARALLGRAGFLDLRAVTMGAVPGIEVFAAPGKDCPARLRSDLAGARPCALPPLESWWLTRGDSETDLVDRR